MVDDKTAADLAKIATTSEKLLNEVARLRRDVVKLYGRIEPFEGEKVSPAEAWSEKPKTLGDAVKAIERARKGIRQVEYDFNYIRGRLD